MAELLYAQCALFVRQSLGLTPFMRLNAWEKEYRSLYPRESAIYFINADLENFLNEIRMIFKYIKNNHVPQESIEKICIYVLRLLEFSDQTYERGSLEVLQNRMLKEISISCSEEEVVESLVRIFSKMGKKEERTVETDEVEKIKAYIDEHYLTLESMEKVAAEFGYNYTYLSRMFKQKTGETMSRYILNKKIELAKDMLENKPELKVTEVSDLCGYGDYRYFTRIFKKMVGVSPSEYKEQIGKFL